MCAMTETEPRADAGSRASGAPSVHLTSSLKYRPEIDGLRAVAVIIVLLFHFNLGLSGGYIGVDVFFVISGFLISSIIFNQIDAQRFRFLDFFERRVRRIAPALLATSVATLIVTWLTFLPTDFELVGTAIVAQPLAFSNIFHWRQSGYFGPAAETLPLLHTWSLAIEEQFYLLFPPAICAVSRWRRSLILPVVAVLLAASFALGVIFTYRTPEAAYYLLPFRAWELLLGSLLAAIKFDALPTVPRFLRETLSALSLAAMLIAAAAYDEATPFPGAYALAPCLAAGVFIWANQAGVTVAGRALSLRPVVFIGKISYSLYLVHWPVFVIYRYRYGADTSWMTNASLAMLSLALATLSWAAVEMPFRDKKLVMNRGSLFLSMGVAGAAIVACGIFIRQEAGLPGRFSPAVNAYANSANDSEFIFQAEVSDLEKGSLPVFGDPAASRKCLLWGDSHAMSLRPAVDAACQRYGLKALQVTHSSTAPLLGYVSHGGMQERGPEFAQAVVQYAIDHHVESVVITAYWANYTRNPDFGACLQQTVERLVDSGVRVIVVRDVAEQRDDVPRMLAMAVLRGEDVTKIGVPLAEFRRRNGRLDAEFDQLGKRGAIVLDPVELMTDTSELIRAEFDGAANYRDAHHLSTAGALRLAPLFNVLGDQYSGQAK